MHGTPSCLASGKCEECLLEVWLDSSGGENGYTRCDQPPVGLGDRVVLQAPDDSNPALSDVDLGHAGNAAKSLHDIRGHATCLDFQTQARSTQRLGEGPRRIDSE